MNVSGDDPVAPRVTGTTRLLGVIGWPVEHSLSPVIHNAAFRSLGMDRVYVALPVEPGGLREAVDGLRVLGFEGANVTMPHKDQSADLADELSVDARLLHAVNTFVIRGGTVRGENTDRPGFDRFLRSDADVDPAGREALILGAGGAARAVALALAQGGAARIVIGVRDPATAGPIADLLRDGGVESEIIAFDRVGDRAPDLVVNATPVGTDGRSMPPLPVVDPDATVVDLLYDPPHTPWRTAAERAGARTFGGLGLLLHQAAAAFELWTGVEAPLDVMSAAAVGALSLRR